MSKRSSQTAGSRSLPCDYCRASKVKCDYLEPCTNCSSRGRNCVYAQPDDSGRVRKFHRRSRNGCGKCKARRVRCDEGRPACGGCQKMGLASQCLYPSEIAQSPAKTIDFDSIFSLPSSPKDPSQTAAPHVETNFYPPVPSIPLVTSQNITNPQFIPSPYYNPHQIAPGVDDILQSASQVDDVLPVSTSTSLSSFNNGPSVEHDPGLMVKVANSLFDQVGNTDHMDQNIHLSTSGITDFVDDSIPSDQDIITLLNNQTLVPRQQNWPSWPMSTAMVAPLHQPDALAAYFPSLEQRYQYRHFFTETVGSLIVVPTSPATNPWLHRLSSLALGSAFGHDPAHDALRYAILSLASFDIGFRIHLSLSNRIENAMYVTSRAQRKTALNLVRLCGEIDTDHRAKDDLILGVALALSFRDRLAGSDLWEEPLNVARDVILGAGGAAAYIARDPSPTRRYLVEQMACVEILALMTVFTPPKLVGWENAWLDSDQKDEPNDHLHVVFGWDRESIKLASKVLVIGDEYRRIMVLREENTRHSYPIVKSTIARRLVVLKQRCSEVLDEAPRIRTALMMTPVPSEVSLLAMAFQFCCELFIQLIVLGTDKLQVIQAQAKVVAILEIADEAMSRGILAGLLLPLSWAAGCAMGQNYDRASKLIQMLQNRYHLEHGLMDRLAKFNWKEFEGISFEEWEDYLRSRGMYVPLF